MIEIGKIQGTYWNDILGQPHALRDTIAGLAPMPELESVREKILAGRLRRLVLTGMGGSYQILHPLHIHLVNSGFNSIMAETSELLYSLTALVSPQNAVVAVSQSGASAETVRLLDRQGPLYIGVSNTPGSPLAARSDLTVLTRAGEEGGVACKTSVTALAALYWVGQHLTNGNLGASRQVLDTIAPAAEAYLALSRHHVDALVDTLGGVKRVFLAGRGASLTAAGLGAMVQKEAAHFHAEGMSSAALRHGPFEMLGPGCFVLVFEGDEDVRQLNHSLVRDVLATGARAATCGFSVSEGPFALPRADRAMLPILELLPAQMMSLALAYLHGHEPGKFERITKVTTVE
jgi:glucosamine--fructose-6-phosphate aminotransferase (isomerizing)